MKKIDQKHSAFAILLAAGNSQRMGRGFKQFAKLKNKPLIFYSIDQFIKDPLISKLIIAVPKEKIGYASKIILKKYDETKIEIIPGGKSRRESGLLALLHLENNFKKIDYVILHDAARPLISKDMIRKVLDGAANNGAAVVGKPAIDLIFHTKNNFIKKAVRKDTVHYGFTPQCFRFEDILKAHLKFKNNKSFETADHTELLLEFNKKAKIKILDDFYPNFKITYKEDLKMIETFLS